MSTARPRVIYLASGERGRRLLRWLRTQPCRVVQAETEIGKQGVDPAQGQTPARIGSFVTGNEFQNRQHRIAVGKEDALGEEDALGASVPLGFPFVCVELHRSDPAFCEQ